jgi:hypothetical protein
MLTGTNTQRARRLTAMLLGLTCMGWSLSAMAQTPGDLPSDSGSIDALRAGTAQRRPYWGGSGPYRPFAAANFELGVLYFRPVLQLGWGKPHYEWFGVEGYSSPGLNGGREYAGLRGVYSHIDVRVGARYEVPRQQRFLLPKNSFDREDLQKEGLGRSRYMTGEAEVTTSFDALGGNFIGVVTGYMVFGVPKNVYLLEESLKVVAKPRYLWRARVGYLYHLGWLGSMRLGAAVESIHLISRQDVVIRVGPLMSVALTHHLEANAAIMIVARSPDALGLDGADIGQIGLRYRWATGDRWAEFP